MARSSHALLFLLLSYSLTSNPSKANNVQPRHEEEGSVVMETCFPSNVVYPHHCQGTECTMGLSWRDHTDWVEFNLTAKTQGRSVWVALGLSENGEMANSDVVTCWYNHHFEIHTGLTSAIGRSITIKDNKDSVILHSANYTNGVVSCHFSRRKIPFNNSSVDSVPEKSLTQNWHILLAWGQLDVSSHEVTMSQHAEKFSTSCPCDVSDCNQMCLCVSQLRFLLFKLHGSVMIIVFVFLLPLAAIIARYYREVFHENWFKSHMTLMLCGVVGMILGLGFILGHTGGKFYVGPHQLIGIITIGASVIQAIIGVFRPHVGKSLKRKLFVFFHRINAVSILLLGTVALFWGAWYIHKEHQIALCWMFSLLTASVVFSLMIALFLELRHWVSKWKVVEPPVKYQKLDLPSSDSEEEEEVFVKENPMESSEKHSTSPPHFREKVILLLFLFQSFTLTGLLSAFIFYRTEE